MNEIKIKTKNLIIVIVVVILLILFIGTSNDCRSYGDGNGIIGYSNGKTIFAITPTYARPVQKAELTR